MAVSLHERLRWVIVHSLAQSRHLVDNPINRYLVNSPMLDKFVRDDDGGIAFHVQHDSPGEALEANWLPAPAGQFFAVLRLYWPKAEALNGTWELPPLKRGQ